MSTIMYLGRMCSGDERLDFLTFFPLSMHAHGLCVLVVAMMKQEKMSQQLRAAELRCQPDIVITQRNSKYFVINSETVKFKQCSTFTLLHPFRIRVDIGRIVILSPHVTLNGHLCLLRCKLIGLLPGREEFTSICTTSSRQYCPEMSCSTFISLFPT